MTADETALVHAVLDDFHAAAAAADEDRYVGHLSETAVFLGTDGSERWEGEEYRAFVHRYFSVGKGWTYRPSGRSLEVTVDGETAWFDESLENEWYGECRGTGVLRLIEGEWKIEQYNLTIPIPNAIAADVVALIRESGEPSGRR